MEDFNAGIMIGAIPVIIFLVIILLLSTQNIQIDNTGRQFCEGFNLSYERFVVTDPFSNKGYIQFECKNETKVDTIGILKVK